MFKLDYKSDNALDMQGPVNLTTGLPLVKIAVTTTATVELFNTSKDAYVTDLKSTLSADEAAAQAQIDVQVITGFGNGDTVHIDLDDGTIHETTINGLPAGNSIPILVALPSAASQGREIRRKIIATTSLHLTIGDVTDWEVGDTVQLTLDSGVDETHTVDQVLPELSSLVLDAVLGGATSSGARVKNKLGASLTSGAAEVVDYGTFPTTVATTVVGDPDWGFRATMPHTHADIALGQRVRVEWTVVDVGVNLFRTGIGQVVNL